MTGEAIEKLPVACAGRGGLIHDDEVETPEYELMLSKRLPHDPLQPIAGRRLAAVFLRNRKPQARVVFIVRPAQDRETSVATWYSPAENAGEGGRCQEPVLLFEPVE